MAQQNNNSQPQGFAGFDDLISDFSEDIAVPLPKVTPAAKLATPASPSVAHSAAPTPPPPAKSVASAAPPSTSPRTDPPKPSSAPQQAPAKPETRVIVEPKPAPNSLTATGERISQKTLWFSLAFGVIIFIFSFSSLNKNQTSSTTSSSVKNQYNSVPTPPTKMTRSEPAYGSITPSITETAKTNYTAPTVTTSRPLAPSKPSTPKVQPDPLVKKIQKKLLSLGYYPGSANGYIGKKTLNAIKQFQKENRLPIDSNISEQLLSSLDRAQPRVAPKRRQKSLSSHSVKSEEKDSVCPKGENCVNHSKESISSDSDNAQSFPQEGYYRYSKPVYNNSYVPPPKVPNSASYNNRKTRIVCPTAIFCYPQPIE